MKQFGVDPPLICSGGTVSAPATTRQLLAASKSPGALMTGSSVLDLDLAAMRRIFQAVHARHHQCTSVAKRPHRDRVNGQTRSQQASPFGVPLPYDVVSSGFASS